MLGSGNGQPAGRRRIFLFGVVPVLLAVSLGLIRPSFLSRLDRATYDAMVRWSGMSHHSGRVTIVDVDERSLASIGQWPWRRDRVGELIARIRDLGATVVALDVIFAEPDRDAQRHDAVAPEPGVRVRIPEVTGPDEALASTLRDGRVVIGYALTFSPPGTQRECLLHPLGLAVVQGDDGAAPFFRASGVVCSLPPLAQAAGASGFLNAAPDADGILRRMPLLLEHEDRTYPSLALAAVTQAIGARQVELRTVDADTSRLTIDSHAVPLDGKSNLLLKFRGARGTFPYVSAADVMSGAAGADRFKDKLVFVGATALGTQEVVSTPFDNLFTGVEVQATVADNLLQQDFFRRPAGALTLETLALLVLGMAVVLAVVGAGVAWGVGAGCALMAVLFASAVSLLAGTGMYLSPLIPAIGMLAALSGAVVASYTGEIEAAVSRERSARREAEAARNVQNEFLMTVTHELRTPLSAIYGWVHMLATGVLRTEQKDRALSTIQRNLQTQTRLIDDLIDASSAASGTLRLNLSSVQLDDVIRQAVDSARPAFDAKRIALDMYVNGRIPPVTGDPERLQLVLWHLLSNAVKFSPDGGRVQLRLHWNGETAEVVVADNGIGISSSFLPHVFERFRQQDMSTTRSYAGVGLGLSLVRHIVELHGGTVSVESEGGGRGATVRVKLPIESP